MAATSTIVGRDAELAAVSAALRAADGPAVVIVEGEAGVGKTTILSAVAAEAGRHVLRARPTEAEAQNSYAALDELLRPHLGLMSQLPEPQARSLARALLLEAGDTPVAPRLVALAFLSVIERLPAPVLLVVDDWQWLDAASNAVLSYALRRLPESGVNVLAAARSGEADDEIATLVRGLAGRVLEVRIEPLDAAALLRLVHERTGEWLAPPELQRLHASSGGNPLVALELVRAPGGGLATDIRRLLGRRIGGLPLEARTALRPAAALAEPTLDLVERATGDAAAARRGLEAALAAEVLERDGDRVRFSHPLIASVVAERSPPGEWRAVHARLATLVDQPEQRVRHLAAAASGPDAETAALLDGASREAAARGALAAAAELSERAAALTPDSAEDARATRLIAASDNYAASGDGRAAQAVLERLVEMLSPGPLRAKALHRMAYFMQYEEGARLGERALAEAGDDDALRADIHITICDMTSQQGRQPESLAHAEAALRHAERAGEPSGIAFALLNVAFTRWVGGGGVQRELLARADVLERQGGDRDRDVTPAYVLGMQLQIAGELAEARSVLEAEHERATRRGHVDHECQVLSQLAQLEVSAGRWRQADEYARQAFEMTLGLHFWNADTMGRWVRALVDAHLGRVESARENAEAGLLASTEWGDLRWCLLCEEVLGFVELSVGDAAAAVERLSMLPGRERRLGTREPALLVYAPNLVEALVLTGDLEAARAAHSELMEIAPALGRPWAIANGLRCGGLIASAEGRTQDALAEFERALELHDEVPRPFDRARTLLALGAVQRRAKQRAEARRTLEAALAVFEELGAALWAERARAEIARLGGRRARDRDELTETERRIAELAADGRSNREIAGELFVSERTVEANLTRAYRKLGVRSRTELARRLPAE